jgi:vanillate/4-hydroxybenzoate decarboxylase subunit C
MAEPFDDLRGFLAALEAENQLLRIQQEVKLEPDLGAAGCAVSKLDGNTAPALLFENIDGFENAKVALNVHGSWANQALMLGLPKDTPLKEQCFELAARWRKFPVPIDRRQEAPWQQVTISENINLFELLPVFRLNPGDGGPYIDKAAVITRDSADPENFGKQNVGVYRLQVKGPDHLGLQSGPPHDFGRHIAASDGMRVGLPVVIAIGNDPILTLAASTPLAYEQSEYEMAGAWRGGVPYPVVKAPLTGLDVPWGSEVVIEGEVRYAKGSSRGPSVSLLVTSPAVGRFPSSRSAGYICAATQSSSTSIWVSLGPRSIICSRSTPQCRYMSNSKRSSRRCRRLTRCTPMAW